MQPPFHVTGNPTVDWIIFGVGVLVCLYWLKALRLAREGARLLVRNFVLALLVFLILLPLLSRLRLEPNTTLIVAGFLSLLVFFRPSRRSRYIRTSVKRAVIARDLKGDKYNPKKHHIDHVWPFSKGGSNTADNLRVIESTRNLKKGAKRPKMREMW